MSELRIRIADPAAEYRALAGEIDAAVARVLASGRYILGPEVSALESEVASFTGAGHAVGVASGTDALVLGLLGLGVGPGDEVIVPAFTFFATAEAVMRTGATPVFCDVEEGTLCIGPSSVEPRLSSATRVVLAVHLFGHPVDLPGMRALCDDRSIALVEDLAQSFGAAWNGVTVGGVGDAAGVSFFPSKNLGGMGDGGMVLTGSAEVAEAVRMLRAHGTREKHRPESAGFNSRLDELQAAILRVKLPLVEAWNQRRRDIALRYDEALVRLPVRLPAVAPQATHAFHLYVIRSASRDDIRSALAEVGIESAVHYPTPLPFTEACAHLGYQRGEFPVTEAASDQVLALPTHPHLSDGQVDEVVAALASALS